MNTQSHEKHNHYKNRLRLSSILSGPLQIAHIVMDKGDVCDAIVLLYCYRLSIQCRRRDVLKRKTDSDTSGLALNR
jgi:hypothetical protein